MTPRKDSLRARTCNRDDAEARLKQARKFLEVAEVAASEGDDPAGADVAASNAILAAIAASDAACCAALGRRSRGESHVDAAVLLEQIVPGGKDAANSFRRLISVKDVADYGIESVSGKKLESVLKQAGALVAFAEDIMRR